MDEKNMNNKKIGDHGEKEVIKLVKCPNCGKELMLLPTNYPLYDVQCTACQFRAQIKTNNSKPKSEVQGAGWEIMNKVLKAGILPPPLIVNFKWKENNKDKQMIYFFPFVPKNHLVNYQLSTTARRANYKMFRYSKLLDLPHEILYKK
ncbi:MAG: hypothetical protein IJP71_02560 [Lachnospiraceae bacterium]|nr:hypothetical protein [Lachnospiraceae bacterium]